MGSEASWLAFGSYSLNVVELAIVLGDSWWWESDFRRLGAVGSSRALKFTEASLKAGCDSCRGNPALDRLLGSLSHSGSPLAGRVGWLFASLTSQMAKNKVADDDRATAIVVECKKMEEKSKCDVC